MDGLLDHTASMRRFAIRIETTILCCGDTNHECDVQEVEEYSTNSSPEEMDVSTSNTFTEENTVMVHIFNANITVFTMLRISICLQLALGAPLVAALDRLGWPFSTIALDGSSCVIHS